MGFVRTMMVFLFMVCMMGAAMPSADSSKKEQQLEVVEVDI